MDLRKIACYTREGLKDCLVYAYYGYLLIRKGRTNDVLKFNVPGHGDHGAVKFLPQKYTALNFHQKIHTNLQILYRLQQDSSVEFD